MGTYKNSLKGYKVYKVVDGEFYFCDSYYDSSIRESLTFNKQDNTVCKKGKVFALTEENRLILLEKESDFKKELEDARELRGGYNVAFFDAGKIFYIRAAKTVYRFICLRKDNVVFNYEIALNRFKFIDTSDFESTHFLTKTKCADLSPLYESARLGGDEYIVRRIRYDSGKATKEDVDYLNEFEDNNILYVNKDVYGLQEITAVKNIRLGKRTFFSRSIWYEFTVTVADKDYKASYHPSSATKGLVYINCYNGCVKISQEVTDMLTAMLGETENNLATRRRMQMESFVYGYADGLERLPKERKNEVLSEMAKVSFEDLKGLPPHHLARLSAAQLYDWLHCSGRASDMDANEFVEKLVKGRKR